MRPLLAAVFLASCATVPNRDADAARVYASCRAAYGSVTTCAVVADYRCLELQRGVGCWEAWP